MKTDRRRKYPLLILVAILALMALLSSCNNPHKVPKAEEAIQNYYNLIISGEIDKAFETTHYEPQYEAFKNSLIEDLKKKDKSDITVKTLGSEQINDNIAKVHLTITHPKEDFEKGIINVDFEAFVMCENETYYVILQDYNIPEKYLQGIVLDESAIRPEHVAQ